MRKSFKKSGTQPSQLERFVSLLNSADVRQEAAAVLLMSGDLLRFNPQKTNFEMRKGYVFCNNERIRAVLMRDRTALTLEGSNLVATSVDNLKRFIKSIETPEAPAQAPEVVKQVAEAEPVAAPAPDKIQSDKSEEELALYRRIVVDLDTNAFAQYIKEKRSRLLKFASMNESVAEEALQMTCVKVLELMKKSSEGNRRGFCTTPEYFDSWLHRVMRNKVYAFVHDKKKGIKEFHIASGGDGFDDANGISEDTLQSEFSSEGVVAYHGHEDPLGFFVRNEDYKKVVEAIDALTVMAQTDLRIQMVLRTSVKVAGVAEQFEGEIEPAEYADLAEENDVPIGTVRSRIFRGRSMAIDFLERLKKGEVGVPQADLALEENVAATTELVAEPR